MRIPDRNEDIYNLIEAAELRSEQKAKVAALDFILAAPAKKPDQARGIEVSSLSAL